MKLNHNFCVAAYKVISRSPIATYYTDLKSMDSHSHETVELYMAALKELVKYHNKLLPSGKFDNNQLLRFNSLAIKLLKGYSNGVIPRLSTLPNIEQKPMGILSTLKNWLQPKPEMSTSDALDAKIAKIKAKKEAESIRAKELLKEKAAEDKEAARLLAGAEHLKVVGKEYVVAVARTRRIEGELAASKEARLEAELAAEDILCSIDSDIESMIRELDIPSPSFNLGEIDDLWDDTSSASEEKETVVEVEKPVIKTPEAKSSTGTGRSRKTKRPRTLGDAVSKETTTIKTKGGKTTIIDPADVGEEGSATLAADAIEELDLWADD